MSTEPDHWELWRIDSKREVLMTNYYGPPAEVCKLTEEGVARQAAGQLPTVSQVVFPADCFRTAEGYAAAKALGDAWAAELGYRVFVEDRFEDEEHDFVDEEDDDFEDEWDDVENDPTDEEKMP